MQRRGQAFVAQLSVEELEERGRDTRREKEREFLVRVFKRIDTKRDGALDAEEVDAYLRKLGYVPRAGEAEQMIWEVDDDGDGVINFDEFEATHSRLVAFDFASSKARGAYEPRAFFNMVEFSIFDNDEGGTIDASEAIAVFHRRYGQAGAMQKLDALVKSGTAGT